MASCHLPAIGIARQCRPAVVLLYGLGAGIFRWQISFCMLPAILGTQVVRGDGVMYLSAAASLMVSMLLATSSQIDTTPDGSSRCQLCWEVQFLRLIFGCMARGGLSASGLLDIYSSFWFHTKAPDCCSGACIFAVAGSGYGLRFANLCVAPAASSQCRRFRSSVAHGALQLRNSRAQAHLPSI